MSAILIFDFFDASALAFHFQDVLGCSRVAVTLFAVALFYIFGNTFNANWYSKVVQ